ncbi:MAG: N-acetylmuramoyl-L-alanine amidase, partial [Prevotella sp.]|nr:N-acetylmuramoyl-L-alanine amidase [Prevotella sp.]
MSKRCLLIVTMIFSVFVAMMAANNDKFTLVIDPGHGGKDAGALGAKSKEKNINLNVALAFGRYVERNCPDVKVIYTRKTDVFIPLNERANIANRNKADLFISVHTNALPNGKVARGFEVYTLGMHRAADNLEVAKRENSAILVENDYKQHYEDFDPNSSESYIIFEFMQDKNMAKSVELAKMIQKDACETAGRVNKGVHQAGFLVLRATSMPSCLIELGFITSQDEENYLNSSAGIDALGKGIYKAFLRYKRKYHKGITVPYAADPTEEVNIPSVVPPREENTAKQEKRKPAKEQSVAAVQQKQPEQETQPRISGLMDTSENTAEV